jgi:hypothetical protein|tara:strand:- start:36 stop:1511 length:1476 start_codon:yes stop_codon:yes gene_type:complete
LKNTSKIILAGFMIALFSTTIPGFLDQEAHAAAPAITTSSMTGANEITIVYGAATTGVKGDYTDLRLTTGNEARTVTSMTGSTSTTHTLTFDGLAVPTDETATMDFGIGLKDTGDNTANVADADQAIVDLQDPVVLSAATSSPTTIVLTMSEAMTENANNPSDFTITGVGSSAYEGGNRAPKVVGLELSAGEVITLTLSDVAITQTASLSVNYVGTGANDFEDIINLDLADFTNLIVTNNVVNNSFNCYDCVGPQLEQAQIIISSDKYLVAPGDELTHITADVGDEISLLLKISDNRTIETIPFVGLYTNFVETPSDMSLFYTNHYDDSQNISASFYEWNIRSDDVAFDYDDTVSWTVMDDPIIGEYFIAQYTMKFTDSMETSQIIVKSSDNAGNYSYETLPVTLEVIGDAPIDFDSKGKQKLLGFFDESVLAIMVSELNTSDTITTPVSSLLGLSDDSLPAWTSNLATWTVQDKINSGDLIVAVEYLINQ